LGFQRRYGPHVMFHQRHARDTVQHLGQLGTHPFAHPRGEHHRREARGA
jgi:hypothetical protein